MAMAIARRDRDGARAVRPDSARESRQSVNRLGPGARTGARWGLETDPVRGLGQTSCRVNAEGRVTIRALRAPLGDPSSRMELRPANLHRKGAQTLLAPRDCSQPRRRSCRSAVTRSSPAPQSIASWEPSRAEIVSLPGPPRRGRGRCRGRAGRRRRRRGARRPSRRPGRGRCRCRRTAGRARRRPRGCRRRRRRRGRPRPRRPTGSRCPRGRAAGRAPGGRTVRSPNALPKSTSSSRPPNDGFSHGGPVRIGAGGATLAPVTSVSTDALWSPGVGSVLLAVTLTAWWKVAPSLDPGEDDGHGAAGPRRYGRQRAVHGGAGVQVPGPRCARAAPRRAGRRSA